MKIVEPVGTDNPGTKDENPSNSSSSKRAFDSKEKINKEVTKHEIVLTNKKEFTAKKKLTMEKSQDAIGWNNDAYGLAIKTGSLCCHWYNLC